MGKKVGHFCAKFYAVVNVVFEKYSDRNLKEVWIGSFFGCPRVVAILLALCFFLPLSAPAVSMAELRADKSLTPERFIEYFADFKFELAREVRPPDVFLASKAGDCDDFSTLAAQVLREKGYHTRLVAVFMPDAVHVVCYVEEAHSYLDYNCRANSSPLVKCESGLSSIASSVAASFKLPWRSVSEFTMVDGSRHFAMTEFH
jgi:hypothetical protein